MAITEQKFERWIWLELIGFDKDQADFGVDDYLCTAGFVPEAICLLLSSIDFVLLHSGIETEATLPADFCAREGHEHNQDRKRQVWTNHQVRGLIGQLHKRGVEVYATVFTQYHADRHHREWASDHPEVRVPYPILERMGGINPLRRLDDGTYFEDLFLSKLLEVTGDYGFDGWHGADCYGPLSGPLYEVDCSDDMVDQFLQARGISLPEEVDRVCGNDYEALSRRTRWIWTHARHEWIEFYADRWAQFWRKMVEALHQRGKKAVINSSWGRAPFESLYRYGIDYKRIADTGVDAIVVETVAAGLSLDPRPNCSDPARHHDFLSMLLLLKAYVPDTKLLFLHNTHDIVERWDVLRHAPALLEKEIYSLANVFVTGPEGRLRSAADGFLVCLGDGLRRHEWQWLRQRWDAFITPPPQRVLGATLVWSDSLVVNQIPDFTRTRSWFAHRLLFHLMERGAMVQSAANVADLAKVNGAILCLNPHLWPETDLEKILSYEGGPAILIGRRQASFPAADFEFDEIDGPFPMWCGVYGAQVVSVPEIEKADDRGSALDVMGIVDPTGYWDHLSCQTVSKRFLAACAEVVQELSSDVRIVSEQESVDLMLVEQDSDRLRVAVKNKTSVYASPEIDLGRGIRTANVVTEFPMMAPESKGSRFTVRVPPRGITVLDIVLAQ